MEIDKRSWHGRWFTWACKSMDRAWPLYKNRDVLFAHHTDVCTYFRTMLMGTLLMMLSVVVQISLVCTFTLLPMWLWGVWPVLVFYGVMMGILTCMLVTLYVVTWLLPELAVKGVKSFRAHVWAPTSNPSTLQLVILWAHAQKHKYCATIKFKETDHDRKN